MPTKLSFTIEVIKNFQDKQKLKKLKPTLQKVLKPYREKKKVQKKMRVSKENIKKRCFLMNDTNELVNKNHESQFSKSVDTAWQVGLNTKTHFLAVCKKCT